MNDWRLGEPEKCEEMKESLKSLKRSKKMRMMVYNSNGRMKIIIKQKGHKGCKQMHNHKNLKKMGKPRRFKLISNPKMLKQNGNPIGFKITYKQRRQKGLNQLRSH